jgi:arginase
MRIALIAVPYDSGFRADRTGAGPLHLLDSGLSTELEAMGHEVTIQMIDLSAASRPAEIAAAFELAGAVANAVAAAIVAGAFPLVLSGNCGPAALGCVGGLQGRTSVVWFDAHGDFNTPETTTSGFLDGMSLATVTGRCWRNLAREIPGFAAISERKVTQVGVRNLDEDEAVALHASEIRHVHVPMLRQELPTALADPSLAGETAYLHVDLDVLDPSEGRMNRFSEPAGLGLSDLRWAIATIAEGTLVRAASLTAFDPASDATGKARGTVAAVAVALTDAVNRSRET